MKDQPSSERMLEGSRADFMLEDALQIAEPSADDNWLSTARNAFENSDSFFNVAMRPRIEDAMALYRSQHPAGSKYHSDSFKRRSKLFRPVIRTAMRKHESAVAVAFLSTSDVVKCEPPNTSDAKQVRAASAKEAMLNYRLKRSIPWTKILIGGYQDASRQGFVVAATEWEYRRATRYMEEVGSDGQATVTPEQSVTVDRPRIRLVPGDNIRIAPGSDWLDPIGSTPYIVELVPMFVFEIEERMNPERYPQGVRYRPLDREQLRAGIKHDYDSIRQAREGHSQDRYSAASTISEYDVVWVHRNIVRREGEDYYFETIGTQHVLSDPVPLRQIDPRGIRPYVWGHNMIEAHTFAPEGLVTLAKPLQEETNEIANLRVDGTRMSIIGRNIVRRGAQVDTNALLRFVPGGIVEVGNVQTDIRWDKAPEVGRTAYEEHNLLRTELDDLLGSFSGATVSADRKLGETVGGMELYSDNVNQVVELGLIVYAETFVKPLLQHLSLLVQQWEDDVLIAQVVGEELRMSAREVWDALDQNVDVTVSVGFGATNPMKRVEKLTMGLNVIGQNFPELMASADVAEIATEVFGALGFRDAKRFFPFLKEEDAKYQKLKAENDQLKAMVESKQQEIQGRIDVAKLGADSRLQIEQMRQMSAREFKQHELQIKAQIEQKKMELAMLDFQIKREQNSLKKAELLMQREALSHSIQMAEREFALQVQTTAVAPPPHAQELPPPRSARELIERLRSPSSTGALAESATGEGMPGVISRGRYGLIPGAEG